MPTIKFSPEQMNSLVVNPKTKRSVKFGNIVTKYGKIKARHSDYLFLAPDNTLRRKQLYAVNKNTSQVVKIDFDANTLSEPFNNIVPKKINIGKTINNYEILSEIPSDMNVNIAFTLSFNWYPSSKPDDATPITETIMGRFTAEQMSSADFWIEYIQDNYKYTADTSVSNFGYENIKINNILTENNKELSLENMVLREAKPLSLTNLYNEDIPVTNGHCIREYMNIKYPKHIQSIKNINTVSDIYNWCVQYRVKMIAYDINHNVIKSYYPIIKQKVKNMIFIAYNNHMYPITNPTLHKHKPMKQIVHIIDEVHESLVEFINNGNVPYNIIMVKTTVKSYSIIKTIDNIKMELVYCNNQDYKICYDILDKLGLLDKLTPTTTLVQIGTIIEELYAYEINGHGKRVSVNTTSFIPIGTKLTKEGYRYKNEQFELDKDQEVISTDVNNAFASELEKLDKLPIIDMKTHIPKKIIDQQHRINPKFKYIVSVPERNLILDNNGEFYGYELLIARSKNIKFTLLEELPVKYVTNYFKIMIPDLRKKLDKNHFKKIMNILIGKMEYKSESYPVFKYCKVMNQDESKTFIGYKQKLNDDYNVGFSQKTNHYVFTRKPIADMIKDNLRISLYNYIESNKLQKQDILQIRTDSITFAPKSNKYLSYISTELGDWKIESKDKFIELKKPIIPKKEVPTFFYSKSGNGTLITGYAGCGKTYDIVNEIIPKLSKSYIVLTPSHTSLEEYRLKECNCDVIQKYTIGNKLPEEDIIIVDEIGMIGNTMWNLLYKCKISGKQIIAYGDFNQLSPVGDICSYDNKNFLNMMFLRHKKNNNNHRNNFTHEYYDKLRDDRNRVEWRKLRDESIDKYNTPYDEAEIIIAYTNITRKKYNKRMCDKLGITNTFDIGAKIICKTNNLREYDIYNNFQFKVDDIDDHDIVLVSKHGIKYTLPIYKFNNKDYFEFGYCVTLYAVQGSSLNSFHYCLDDIRHLNGRGLYTLISRIKNK